MIDPRKTITSDAGSDEILTFEIYKGGQRTKQGGGGPKYVMQQARTYALSGELDQLYVWRKGELGHLVIPEMKYWRGSL